MGLFSFVGSLLGAGSSKKASRNADAAMLEYLNRAIDEQRRQFDVTRADYAPYLTAGTEALGDLGDIVGINGGDVQSSAIDALKESPLFQSIFRTGEEAILQTASATGGLRGGNTARGLVDFGADTLSRVISEQLSRLGGLAGLGSGATDAVSGFGANASNNISNLLATQGKTKAGGILTRGGINAGMWNSAGSFLDDIVTSFLPGGGGAKGLF